MGTDACGKIAFGIPSSEDLPIREILQGATKDENGYWSGEDGDGPDAEDRYFIAKSGKVCPDFETDRPGWDKWHEDKRDFMKDHPIDVMLSGSDYELRYNIVIKDTALSSEWGEIKPIKSLEIKPEWIDALKDYCETMSVPYQEPVWFLTSLYF